MQNKFKQIMEDAMKALQEIDEDGENFICVNWVLITEWADYEGTRYLHTEVSDEMTPWNAYGMIRMAEKYNSEVLGTESIEQEEEDE
jgi:hypothetical protein